MRLAARASSGQLRQPSPPQRPSTAPGRGDSTAREQTQQRETAREAECILNAVQDNKGVLKPKHSPNNVLVQKTKSGQALNDGGLLCLAFLTLTNGRPPFPPQPPTIPDHLEVS